MEDYYLIAEITSVYNTDGYVRVKSYSDFPERFFLLNEVYIDIFGDYRIFVVEDVESIEDYFILKFKNFNSDEDAEFLISSKIFVNKSGLVPLDDETFFIHDLLGCKAFYNEKFFGKIVNVLSLTSNDVYVVEDESGFERLIPAVGDFIESVNISDKLVILKQDFDELGDDEDWYYFGSSRLVGKSTKY